MSQVCPKIVCESGTWILLQQEMMRWHLASAGPYANHLHLAPDK